MGDWDAVGGATDVVQVELFRNCATIEVMETQVLIQALPDARFRVTGIGRFAVSAEAETREAAIQAFQRAAADAEIVTINVPVSNSSIDGGNVDLLNAIGQGRNLPGEEWQAYLETLRQLREEENAAVPDE